MNWILSLSSRTKLTYGVGLIMVLLLFAQSVYYFKLEDAYSLQRSLYDQHVPKITTLHRLESSIAALRSATLELLQVTGAEREGGLKVQDVMSQINTQLARINQFVENDQALGLRIHDLNSAVENHVATLKNTVMPLIDKKEFDAAADVIYGDLASQNQQIRKMISGLQEAATQSTRNFLEASRRNVTTMEWSTIAIGAVAILIALGLIGFMDKYLSLPLKTIAQLLELVAQGDLSIKLPETRRRDEVGRLITNVNNMIDSLNAIAQFARRIAARDLCVTLEPKSEKDVLVLALNDMASNLRSMTGEISHAATMLASSSVEILAGTSQMAASSTETATAVSQTTATVEEVRQTSSITNSKARHVAESSRHAVDVSTSGRQFMEDTINGMNRIAMQMEMIAESIIKLSEQSRAIAEIISAVNDLAEQTNLLAVNASIEAARAGEQGKGFVVVAQEIKNLADQSKQATMQVRTILSDIQGAISAAVTATEQGSHIVETGISQSKLAEQTIQTLAASIDDAAQAAIQIAASSQEQSIGMDQVAFAMESIKNASAQNVATNRELEISSHALQQMGQKLKDLVEQYKIQ